MARYEPYDTQERKEDASELEKDSAVKNHRIKSLISHNRRRISAAILELRKTYLIILAEEGEKKNNLQQKM